MERRKGKVGVLILGLKHGKYVYVERKDGWYVKVRVLNIRLKKKGKEEKYSFDINDPEKYLVLNVKARSIHYSSQIIKEEDLPEQVRRKIWEV